MALLAQTFISQRLLHPESLWNGLRQFGNRLRCRAASSIERRRSLRFAGRITAHRTEPLAPELGLQSTATLGLQRYLLPFDPRQVPVYRFDLLVLGSGIGGTAAAVAAAEEGASVAVVSKADLQEGSTRYAQGGMAAVLGANDTFESHVDDTLRVGCGLADRDVVEAVVRGGPEGVKRLVEWGAEFDRGANGELELAREGGHSRARILHAHGDATGKEMQRALVSVLEENSGITSFANTFAIDLVTDTEGHVLGALCRTSRGDLVIFRAARVLLATGGAGQIYRETTNPTVATGDGVALAFRAGAQLRDLEFMQFHPTLLYIAGAARYLISEIVRGHGGVLRDRHGERFMPDYHPDAELAPRDVVSRAVFSRMVETQDTNVYLDVTNIDRDPCTLFPGITSICSFFGIDIKKDFIPVRPGAHYMIGGIAVDLDGRTSVPGLFAIGECSSSGLHGANRMGSNSLLEGLVLGSRAGRVAAREMSSGRPLPFKQSMGTPREEVRSDLRMNLDDVTYSLKSMMWRQMGVLRDAESLREAEEKLEFWARIVQQLAPAEVRSWELMNMLTVSRLATLGALAREESRGVHFRTDFDRPRPGMQAHINLTPQTDGDELTEVRLSKTPVNDSLPIR